jgi:hypothetical protein
MQTCKEVPYQSSQCVTRMRDNEGGATTNMDVQPRAFVGKARVMGLTLQKHLSFQERQIVASFSSETHNFRYSPLLLDLRDFYFELQAEQSRGACRGPARRRLRACAFLTVNKSRALGGFARSLEAYIIR